jgi:SNF family Na+-dependent transporter
MAASSAVARPGRIGFVLALAGAALGLGNIWRFPFITGVNGGAVFLLIYLAMVLLIGYPLFISETLLGKVTRKSPVAAFRQPAPDAHPQKAISCQCKAVSFQASSSRITPPAPPPGTSPGPR